ncbi:hypothetical protein SASPL_151184 [Salvia splendens]|uniref:Uncharacterized protein n=1 Tax=Salvia splendens TaxID=180675 RepID=A0A8X8Z2S0_SALSN|nr:hypothetical protein SASPL_151184 [Salvia splendens]
MQQMVSRANIPRTMMSLTPLAEPEKRELEWESRWGQRKLESHQFEVRWEKMMQQLRDMIVPKPSGGVAVADKEFNFESPVEEVDLHLESHDGEWIVQRSTSTTNEHADSHESHEKEGEPIGELFLSCNITYHHQLEVMLTPRQKTEELELSIPLPHNCNLEKVNDIDSEP